jgi:hypothetical protein
MVSRHLALGCVFVAVSLPAAAADTTDRAALEALITKHAKANGVPVSLVHRVVRRESNYNPRASHRGNLGLMQIRHGTARGMGYSGSAAGLLDADTNLSYVWSLNRLSSVRARRLMGDFDCRLLCGRCQLYRCSQIGNAAARWSAVG